MANGKWQMRGDAQRHYVRSDHQKLLVVKGQLFQTAQDVSRFYNITFDHRFKSPQTNSEAYKLKTRFVLMSRSLSTADAAAINREIFVNKIHQIPFKSLGFSGAFLVIALSLAPLGGHTAPRPQYRITELELFPGGRRAIPRGINNQGHVVGVVYNARAERVAFLYRDGVMTELHIGERDPGGYMICSALDINDSDQILAEGLVGGHFHHFFITPQETNDLNAQTGLNVSAARLNNQGQVAGYVWEGSGSEAIWWSNGVVQFLGQLDNGYASEAWGINNFGMAVGTAYVQPESPLLPYCYAVVFQDGQVLNLGLLPGADASLATALNDYGEVVGVSGTNAFLYRGGPLIALGVLPGFWWSRPYDINNSGQVVGICEDHDENDRPFLYDQGVMYDLNDLLKTRSDWVLSWVVAINDRGQIIGAGYHNGLERPFVLTPMKKPKR